MKLIHIKDLSWQEVSHNPEVKKKIIIEKGQIPQLMTFGQSTFQPGQKIETHNHPTMFEVFYILEGKAEYLVEGQKMILESGDNLTVEPGENHAQANPFETPVTWLYFGIATD
jgi:quercetin dioxygenase-like cupin family protein